VWGGSKLHVDMSATTRVALPTRASVFVCFMLYKTLFILGAVA